MNGYAFLSILVVCLFGVRAFSTYSSNQVKMECYKVNVELAKQNVPIIDCNKG